MPTYYLMQSRLLRKNGIKAEQFAAPSGNLTMQQVAQQSGPETFGGRSFVIGHEKESFAPGKAELRRIRIPR